MILVKNVKTTKTIVFYTPTLNTVKEMIIWGNMIYLNNLFFWTSENLFHTFICFLRWKDEIQRKIVSSKTSDLIFDVIRTIIFEETYFSFYYSVLTIDRVYTLNRCWIIMQISRFLFSWNCDGINTRNSILRTNQ